MSDPTTPSKSLTTRCREFFGLKEGQKLSEFAAELRALSPAEKEWFCGEFNKMGLPTVIAVS